MNKKIKELAEKSGAFIVDPEHAKVGGITQVGFVTYTDFEKFVESIIKECSLVAYGTSCPYEIRGEYSQQLGHTWDMACITAGRSIKEYFEN